MTHVPYVYNGDCLELIKTLASNSVDSGVMDPPYGLGSPPTPAQLTAIVRAWILGEPAPQVKGRGFMGKSWDAFVPAPAVWRETYRVLKPGAHVAIFGGTRTYDLVTLGLRLAGFEIRDTCAWIYGQGMTKGPEAGKAIDEHFGVLDQRPVLETVQLGAFQKGRGHGRNEDGSPIYTGIHAEKLELVNYDRTAPFTPEAELWNDWRTNLRPSLEPIIIARKPLEGTLAENLLKWGTGAINAGGCRLDRGDALGGLPANVMLDEDAAAELDAQVGNRRGMSGGGKHKTKKATVAGGGHDGHAGHIRNDNGGPSRFFYIAKATRAEREEGLENLPELKRTDGRQKPIDNPYQRQSARKNHHPTVKPRALIQYLQRLVTPPGGLTADWYTGSGTAAVAAILEGFRFIGAEADTTEGYMPIIHAKIAHALRTKGAS